MDSNINKIEEAFLQEGYKTIPFTFNGAGHPIIVARIFNSVDVHILLDTGASANLLDYDFAKNLALTLSATGEKGGGAGGIIHDVYQIEKVALEINGHNFTFDDFLSMDFSTIRESLTSNGVTEDFQGILGFGFFKSTHCFIDYRNNRLFVDVKNNLSH